MNSIKEMSAEEFIRRFKNLIEEHEESRFIFFLGAGCSVSSGIPSARTLVKDWLPRLKKLKTGCNDNCDSWINEIYPDYTEDKASLFYGKVIEDLFLTPEERQREIERLTEGKDPGFGYAVLAQMMTFEDIGRHCNVVQTVNFDDLIADALYLYTQKKPLVISHESLAGFVKISRTRPLILKLHGDARLDPKNTEKETQGLAENVRKVLKNLLYETGLIFIGYGGHDESIAEILDELPSNALPWGIYWIGNKIPDSKIGMWLTNRNARWIKQSDFDELMLLMWKEFNFSHPKKDRFDKLLNTYFDTFKNLKKRIEIQPEKEDDKPLKEALEKASNAFESWHAVVLEADKYEKNDPERADIIYQEGLKRFPDSKELLGTYALFFHIQKDYDKAEEYYKKALEIDPKYVNVLCNYASFLGEIRKDYDKAEEYYKKALGLDPKYVNVLGNYALFLSEIRKDYDKAEEYYKKALGLDPKYVNVLGNYAQLLNDIRKDYDKAEEYYKKVWEIDPKDATNLGNFAGFLLARGNENGFSILEKALELAREQSLKDTLLECLFYQYAHSKDKKLQRKSLEEIKILVKKEKIRSPGWNLSDNIERAIKDGHPDLNFVEKLAKVISGQIDIRELDDFEFWNK